MADEDAGTEGTTTTEQTSGAPPKERDWASEASGMGWNADHDGPDRIDAKEFVLRKPLFDQSKKQRRKIRELETSVNMMHKQMTERFNAEKVEKKAELTAAQNAAKEDGDAARAVELTERINQLEAQAEPQQARAVPEYGKFLDNNAWYEDNHDMKLWADAFGNEYRAEHPNSNLTDMFTAVQNRVKDAYPDYFRNKNRDSAASVESGGNSRSVDSEERTTLPKEHKPIVSAIWNKGMGAYGDVPYKKAVEIYIKDYTERFGDFEED